MCLTNLPHNWNSLWRFFSRCILAHKSQNCSILPEQLALNWTLTVVDRCWSRYHFRETSHLLSIKLQILLAWSNEGRFRFRFRFYCTHYTVPTTLIRLRFLFQTLGEIPWVPDAFHARFTVSSQSGPREKPLDQSAIPLIAPSQLQPRLYTQTSRIWMFCWLVPWRCRMLQTLWIDNNDNRRVMRDAGGLKVTKIDSKQSKNMSPRFFFFLLEKIWDSKRLYERKI